MRNNTEWRAVVREDIECEGFCEVFIDYNSLYDWIDDDTFHELKDEFVRAARKLATYIADGMF